MGLIGVEEAIDSFSRIVRSFTGCECQLVILCGGPGSGKTTIAEAVLKEFDYVVYKATAGESTTRETARAKEFCKTSHSVEVLLAFQTSRRRAVLLDDSLPDARSIATVFDALKAMDAKVLVVASIQRSVKAPEVRRRASKIIAVPYPPKIALSEHLRRAFPTATNEAIRRASACCQGSVRKAEQLVVGESYGTKAKEDLRVADTTIFDVVERGYGLCLRNRPYKDVETAISCEPSMATMILKEAIKKPTRETRETFRWLSKTNPGSWFGPIASTVAFAMIARTEQDALNNATLKFPRCYTTASSRATNLKKMTATDAKK